MPPKAFPLKILFGLYFFAFILFALFSYSLVHPSLVLVGWKFYWQYQTWIWKNLFNNHQLLAEVYTCLIILLFAIYFFILAKLRRMKTKPFQAKMFIPYLFLLLPLFVSYNALSYDVFNYIFNAKMVVVYHANPHLVAAMHYEFDPWTRFMSNTYGLAPYGYGWTTISLLPYILGFNKFLPTWLLFRAFSILGIFLLYLSLQNLAKKIYKRGLTIQEFGLVFLNPLFLIEMVSSAHNDLWMMWPAVLAFSFILGPKIRFKHVALSFVFLLFSLAVKLSTMILLPLWALVLWKNVDFGESKSKLAKLTENYWPTIASFLMFLPLLTFRARQFYPWYLVWVFVWLPFIKFKPWKFAVVILSVTAMLRYIPWLYTNSFTDAVELQQKLFIWVPFVAIMVLAGFVVAAKKKLR